MLSSNLIKLSYKPSFPTLAWSFNSVFSPAWLKFMGRGSFVLEISRSLLFTEASRTDLFICNGLFITGLKVDMFKALSSFELFSSSSNLE
jgi:hypothetical protein